MSIDWPYEFPGAYWIDQEEEEVLLDVLRNGSMFRYYGLGDAKYVDAYEEAARRFYGTEYALGLNSGTGALITAMTAMGIGPGCEVILPAFMWVASVAAVIQVNAIPVLCEIDESFCMDPADLEKKITSRTRLILPIHMAGAPCDMNAIMAVAGKYNIPVLEDCAQCNGGSFGGRKVGTIGDMGIFSLQLNKNMTCGEGGLLITNDQRLFQRAFSAHDMGLIRRNGRLATPEQWAISWGAGRRMTELCGSVAGVQLKKLPKILESMRMSKSRIKAGLEGTSGLDFRKLNDAQGDTGPFLILILKSEQQAVSAAEKMKISGLHSVFRVADYGLHIYYNIPSLVDKVPLSPSGNPWSLTENLESHYTYNKGACPRSDDLFARSILVPIPSCLTEEQEQQGIQAIRQAVQTAQPATTG
ncbi:MAG: DegT/DnrJ/EryC1/StrS family aminotransferase [Pirellulales bacterium]|nr:DegT/DnrJ/EryC1/StrS family aminotransferase [Pirellulales bacterium]